MIVHGLLVGFSKGGMVVNQILTEMSGMARSPCSEDEDLMRFANTLKQVHYVDVGLNCPGAYIWDDEVIQGIALLYHRSCPDKKTFIILHGTRRQLDTNKARGM